MSADFAPHLVVSFAQSSGDDWLHATAPLSLQNLDDLLRGMKLINTDTGAPDSLSPPHERVYAKVCALPSADGLIPWAAMKANAKPNAGCAFITPCHWAMGREHATMTDPATLALSETESRTLLAAMQPYFATEGITLHYAAPTRWLADGDVFSSLPTASLDRMLGRNVDRWLPASRAIKLLQNEMQMLLYTHPINDERAAKGQRSVNSFWVSGSGALTAPTTVNSHVNISRALASAALANDWTAYAVAWSQLDATDIAELLDLQNSGKTVRISLCGESNAITFETAKPDFLTKFKSLLSRQPLIEKLKQL